MPGEALNHAFVTLAHLVDYAHCNNVKASVQMMEVNIVIDFINTLIFILCKHFEICFH